MVEQHQTQVGGSCRRAHALAAMIACVALLPSASSGAVVRAATGDSAAAASPAQATTAAGPRVIDGDVAETLVLVRGGAVCSGTPIAGTRYVATAAHCVLGRDGRPERRTVVRDGVIYEVSAVWVDTRYADDPTPRFDAAILEVERDVPGRSAIVAPSVPAAGTVTVAGFQPVDVDGETLLRGDDPNDRPSPSHSTGHVIHVKSRPAGCTVDVAEVEMSTTRLDLGCGLIPGASGGGLFAHADGEVVLVGIISTVSYDVSSNGLTPSWVLNDLLQHPERYRYPTSEMTAATAPAITRF